VINTKREPLSEALAKRGVDGGPTLIYDAVGHPSILEEAVRIAAPAGRIGVLGFSTHPSAIPQQELTKKELTLYASRLNCTMFPRVIDWVAKGLVRPDRIITHRIDFRDVAGAFAVVEGNPKDACKVLLEFPNGPI
jgi:L-gulonate 5-dehydrogenase